jgi:nicotinamide-nucleotide amidase
MPRPLGAEILSTGDEIRCGSVVDSNAAWIAERLETAGVPVLRHTCVGDDRDAIAAALSEIGGRAAIAVVTGGLGPTADDRTAEAAAQAAGVPLLEHPEALEVVKRFLSTRGVSVLAANRKQARLPDGAACLDNPEGSAPGFRLRIGGCQVICLPGVPHEMEAMLQRHVLPRIQDFIDLPAGVQEVAVINTFGMPESAVGERLEGLEADFPGIRLGLRVVFPEIQVRLYGCARERGVLEGLLAQATDEVCRRLGKRVVSTRGEGMAAVLGEVLRAQGRTLAVAESCTGGIIGALLTDVAGSSDYFLLSAVTYANAVKTAVLGVAPEVLERWGAVHEATARAMAQGARQIAGADYGLATTGIAGPGGGSADKPVGTVCIGLASAEAVLGLKYVFAFNRRDMNRRMFAVLAMDRLRLWLRGELGAGAV